MQIRLFRIPVEGCSTTEAELNAFLLGRKVLRVTRELVERDSSPGWALCVEYLEAGEVPVGGRPGARANKVDYREVLSEADFVVFSRLRTLRKTLAETEGVPVYAVFTNEQLAEMAKARPASKAALGAIEGIGESRVEKYGEVLLRELGGSGTPEPEPTKP
jgi:superfamily II DNA helicase RecQ